MLKAPFPWVGGKAPIAGAVWDALGDVSHYLEPFGGSMAVLLSRPHRPTVETVNDLNHYLVNFWRSVRLDPKAVAAHAENPVAEADLYARNTALIRTSDEFRQKILEDPEYFDPKIAGWWVWGQSSIIGRPFANDICQKMPLTFHSGVNAIGADVPKWFGFLAERLRHVRVLCGSWDRCLGPTALGMNKSSRVPTAGVFLDPPYVEGDYKYSNEDSRTVWGQARQWAIDHGSVKHLRIVLAGYDNPEGMPSDWTKVTWKGHGGLGRKSKVNSNREKEVLWLSPFCEKPSKVVSMEDFLLSLDPD